MTTVGIIGAGFMSRTHIEAYRSIGVNVAAIASPSGPDEFIADQGLDATTYTDPAQLCTDSTVDFVDICTPTDTHVDTVRTVVEEELPLFIEKPIALSLDGAREIDRLIASADVTAMVGHVLRFFPEYRRAYTIYDRGDIGAPGVARARRLSPAPAWGSDDWYLDQNRSGGVFVDLAIHDFDYLRWLWGDVERVFARENRDDTSAHGFATLRFENDAVGYVEASWAQPRSRGEGPTTELELAGEDGLIELSTPETDPYREYRTDEMTIESPVAKDGYHRELEHFIQCVKSGQEPSVTIADAIEALKLSLAARKSAECGQPVRPAEVEA